MIRAALATTIMLAGSWYAGVLALARVDDRSYQGPATLSESRRAQPTVLVPAHVSPEVSRAKLNPTTDPSKLALRVASAPVPRPLRVQTLRPLPRPATPEEIVRGHPVPSPPDSLRNASDLSCIAVAIYHEARDQGDLGQRAVASVIVQRAAIPHRWGDTPCANVVPTQFSFLTSRYDYPPIDDMKAWEKAVRFAAHVLLEGPLPELNGADHYHTTSVSPSWAPEMDHVRLIGDHVFYADPRSSLSL